MKADGTLNDLDFASIANFMNSPQANESLAAMMGTTPESENDGAASRTKITYTAHSALLRIPEDKAEYDAVLQLIMDQKAVLRQEVHHFDGTGNLRVWLTWVVVKDEADKSAAAKT